MCNDYGNHVACAEYAEALRQVGMPILAPMAAPNLEPRDDIWPTETTPILRRHGEGVELAQLRWGLEPANPKARVVINFRSEGRSFANSKQGHRVSFKKENAVSSGASVETVARTILHFQAL